jgi:hypothetical protein
MKEQLISFNTAKLAKEKGFDIEVRTGYHGDFGELKNDNYPFLGTYSFLADYPCDNKKEYQISTPTQSLLQKWLRDVHLIHISVRRIYPESYRNLFVSEYNPFVYLPDTEEPVEDTIGDEFGIYEDALERALEVALKHLKK